MSVGPEPEHVDVLIVGAGLSGIGAACHLQAQCPGKTFALLEARHTTGGTWDLFRYPGVRSDSDMYTLGYSFRPWRDETAIADGSLILGYLRDTAREHDIDRKIRFHHRVVRAEWSTPEARWTVRVERGEGAGDTVFFTCSFLYCCTGYYRYDEGYTPEFPGLERFTGVIVHPQHWPEDLDYAEKRIVVIGSGATAVTLIPALARQAEHVTMLQRSPGYIVSQPKTDALAGSLGRLLPSGFVYWLVRWKHLLLTMVSYELCQRRPTMMKGLLRKGVERQLPAGYDIDADFSPRYDPWDQRLCLVPDGDLFTAMRDNRASVTTDTIDTVTERGILLTSGAELEADIIVTATGLSMLVLGGMTLAVDGHDVDLSQTVAYKGIMFSDVPNLVSTFGYINASWTLKADLISSYVCRLLNRMEERRLRQCTPHWSERGLPTDRFLNLDSGYVLRAAHTFPKQSSKAPWRLYQNYLRDIRLLRYGDLEDEALELSNTAN